MSSRERWSSSFRLLATLWTVLGVGCTPAREELSAAHGRVLGDSVRVALGTYQRYMAASQWDSLVGLYRMDPSFAWIEDGKRFGASAMRKGLMSIPSGVHVQTSYDSTEVAPLAPGLAVLSTYYHTQFVGPIRADFSGAITMLWAHESAGWRIIGGHSSTRKPRAQ